MSLLGRRGVECGLNEQKSRFGAPVEDGVMDKNTLFYLGLAALLIASIVLLFSPFQGEGAWEQFKAQHHCASIGQATGNNRAGYRCDDGKIYYRWRQQR